MADVSANNEPEQTLKSTSNTSESVNNEQQNDTPKKAVGRGWRWLALLLIILLIALVGAVAWYGLQVYKNSSQAGELDERQVARLDNISDRLSAEKSARANGQATLVERIDEMQSTVDAQSKEIAGLSALDRDEWLYAELEYLVRLADQRLLTERRPQGALALLEAADKLLLSLNNTGALSVRNVLAQDIAALRLVELVDREGIYSRLGALTPSLLTLSALPTENLRELIGDEPDTNQADESPGTGMANEGVSAEIEEPADLNNPVLVSTASVVETPWYETLWSNARLALARFSEDHFHVRYRDVPIEALISSEQEQWLRQDMVINISNAQQALLRDEEQIYKACLTTVASHLQSYFQGSQGASALIVEVEALGELNVKQALPDISASIDAVRRMQRNSALSSDAGGA